VRGGAGDGQQLLASADDAMVRIWDPATGKVERIRKATPPGCTGCAVRVHERELLASADDDRTVRVWDPAIGMTVAEIPTAVLALAVTSFATGALFVGLESGVLAVQVNGPNR
jgi:WD40 repeat protein